jgi:hypothetical protein
MKMEWLGYLRQGDEVAILDPNFYECIYFIGTVERITDVSIVVDGIIFDRRNGAENAKSRSKNTRLVKLTQEVRDHINTYRFKCLIKAWTNNAGVEKLKRIWDYIGEVEK